MPHTSQVKVQFFSNINGKAITLVRVLMPPVKGANAHPKIGTSIRKQVISKNANDIDIKSSNVDDTLMLSQ